MLLHSPEQVCQSRPFLKHLGQMERPPPRVNFQRSLRASAQPITLTHWDLWKLELYVLFSNALYHTLIKAK